MTGFEFRSGLGTLVGVFLLGGVCGLVQGRVSVRTWVWACVCTVVGAGDGV